MESINLSLKFRSDVYIHLNKVYSVYLLYSWGDCYGNDNYYFG